MGRPCVTVLKKVVSELPRFRATPSDGLVIASMHFPVVSALCSRGLPGDATNAYSIINAHKYYGLKVTSDLVRPLVAVYAAKGDSRAFNLVDVCTLFSGSAIDVETVDALFECCAAAHDHRRARTLLDLLREEVPGIVTKLSDMSIRNLQ